MATYAELIQAQGDSALRTRVMVACIIAAEAIRTAVSLPSNQPARLAWAKKVFENPRTKVKYKPAQWYIEWKVRQKLERKRK